MTPTSGLAPSAVGEILRRRREQDRRTPAERAALMNSMGDNLFVNFGHSLPKLSPEEIAVRQADARERIACASGARERGRRLDALIEETLGSDTPRWGETPTEQRRRVVSATMELLHELRGGQHHTIANDAVTLRRRHGLMFGRWVDAAWDSAIEKRSLRVAELWETWGSIVQRVLHRVGLASEEEVDSTGGDAASLMLLALTVEAQKLGPDASSRPKRYWSTIAERAIVNAGSLAEQDRLGLSGISEKVRERAIKAKAETRQIEQELHTTDERVIARELRMRGYDIDVVAATTQSVGIEDWDAAFSDEDARLTRQAQRKVLRLLLSSLSKLDRALFMASQLGTQDDVQAVLNEHGLTWKRTKLGKELNRVKEQLRGAIIEMGKDIPELELDLDVKFPD